MVCFDSASERCGAVMPDVGHRSMQARDRFARRNKYTVHAIAAGVTRTFRSLPLATLLQAVRCISKYQPCSTVAQDVHLVARQHDCQADGCGGWYNTTHILLYLSSRIIVFKVCVHDLLKGRPTLAHIPHGILGAVQGTMHSLCMHLGLSSLGQVTKHDALCMHPGWVPNQETVAGEQRSCAHTLCWQVLGRREGQEWQTWRMTWLKP